MSKRDHVSKLLRYAALQLPGVGLAAAGLFGLAHWLEWPGWVAPLGLALWIAHDAIMYPFVRRAFDEGEPRVGAGALIGQAGIALDALEPRGYVRIGGELWRAEVAKPDAALPAGARVRVCAVDGLWLVVEPESSDPTGGA